MKKLLPVVCVGALVVGACGGTVDEASPDVSVPFSADAPSGEMVELSVPSGEIVLTIDGAGRPNVGDQVQLDIEGIESLGTATVTLYEPFLNADLEMTGVSVDTFLEAAGIGPDDLIEWIAIDDYRVGYNRAEAAAENAILATRIDGEPIGIADGGPVRVVFPSPDGDLARDTTQWIWSLSRIEVG